MKKFCSQYLPRRAKKFMVAKKKAASSPTHVLQMLPVLWIHVCPMDTVPTPMDTASTPTNLPSYVASKSMKKIRLASKCSKY